MIPTRVFREGDCHYTALAALRDLLSGEVLWQGAQQALETGIEIALVSFEKHVLAMERG